MHAAEQDRPDVAAARAELKAEQSSLRAKRLVFIDETSVTTKMVRHSGRSPRGERLVASVPHGHWKTLTFIAALRISGLTAPYVIDGAMDGQLTTLYIERVMDAIERAVPRPQVKIVVHRAARRQVLRDRSPLATGAQHIHQAIDHLAYIDGALVAASLGWRNQRLHQRPFLIGQIARINPNSTRDSKAGVLGREILPTFTLTEQGAEEIVAYPAIAAGRIPACSIAFVVARAIFASTDPGRPSSVPSTPVSAAIMPVSEGLRGLPCKNTLRAVPGSIWGGCNTFERKMASVTQGTRLAPRPNAACLFSRDARRFALRLASKRGLL